MHLVAPPAAACVGWKTVQDLTLQRHSSVQCHHRAVLSQQQRAPSASVTPQTLLLFNVLAPCQMHASCNTANQRSPSGHVGLYMSSQQPDLKQLTSNS
jgi:hypothetical protein